tara:strand:- start:787 stop:1383 length:597 start_codon:yes stop_codon:yes gene_type:complete
MNQLAWSVMSGKMEGIPALNTDTTTNKFCIAKSKDANSICSKCYSWNMLKTFRKNAVPRFQLNSKLLSERVLEMNELVRPKGNNVRFNAHGELINANHVQNLVNYALFYPKVTFTLWTKKKGLIRSFFNKHKKPKNLILIYSNEIVGTVYKSVPAYFDKVFNVVNSDLQSVNCTGKCIDCMMCYTQGNETEQIIEKIK